MAEFENVLIVAFDGLDYEKIKKYDCKNIQQDEFGKIDITSFERFGTPWLWASFLTGEKHDFRYVKKLSNSKLENLETFFWKNLGFMTKWSGIRGKYIYDKLLRQEMTNHTKEDLEHPSFIEELGMDSYYVPAYNEYTFNEFAEYASSTVKALGDGEITKSEAFRRHRGLFLRQKEELQNLLKNKPQDSMMFYFKFTDSVQHLIFNEEDKIDYMGQEYTEKDLYHEIDNLAQKIKQNSEHDLILFVSDHGLDKGDHNENAFYSTNQVFELESPAFTGFKSILMERVKPEKSEVQSIDI